MYHLTFQETSENIPYKLAVVLPYPAIQQKKNVEEAYCKPFGIDPKEVIFFGFITPANGKQMPAKEAKDAAANVMAACEHLGIKTIYIAETSIFKAASGVKKATPYLGIPTPCKDDTKPFTLVYGINHQRLFYDPSLKMELERGFNIAYSIADGRNYEVIPPDLRKKVVIVDDYFEIQSKLIELLSEPKLSLDAETFSLKFYEAGLGTFTLSPSEELAYAFPCDVMEEDGQSIREVNIPVRRLLKTFLDNYRGTMVYHNGSYDMKVLIYVLYMEEKLHNLKGMLTGIEALTTKMKFEDTKLITYVATNSTSGNDLSLKHQAREFAGNYGLGDDIKDILKIKLEDLLIYNGIDGLSTNYVYNKHWPTVLSDNQEYVYREILLKSVKLFLQAELTGIPISLEKVKEVEEILKQARKEQTDKLYANPAVLEYVPKLQQKKVDQHNAKLKTKRVGLDLYSHITYNPGSDQQTVELLIEQGQMVYEDTTDSGAPSVSKDALIKIKALNQDKPIYLEIVDVLIELSQIDILLDNFIEAFKNNSAYREGMGYFLFGSFNIGGTVSGRLSSSKPNLQNLPSKGNKYAYLIKSCFVAPKARYIVDKDKWRSILAPYKDI
jgi:DNA polymerase-1